MRNLLGGKGANLAEMTRLGLPVPQGFTITTEACTRYYEDDCQISDEIKAQIDGAVTKLEEITGKSSETVKSSSCFRSLRCQSIHARHDGYHFEPRFKRRSGRGACKEKQTTKGGQETATGDLSKCIPTW